MKKVFFFLLLTMKVAASHYSYGDVHTLGGYPMVGAGIRGQSGFFTVDLSIHACPLNLPKSLSVFHARGLYLFYPLRGIYLGGGMGFVSDPEIMRRPGSSFEGSAGIEWKLGRSAMIFAEVDGTVPFSKRDFPKIWPGLTMGLCF